MTAINFDYFRPGRPMSPCRAEARSPRRFAALKGHDVSRAVNDSESLRPLGPERHHCDFSSKISTLSQATVFAALLAALPAAGQYAGKVPEQTKSNGPELRAVAVLEWTGEPGHPKASRLVPISLWDGQDLQDASIYMAQPEPLALQTDVEYKLKQDGKTVGLYDVSTAGQSQGTWIGFGAWKPLPSAKPAAPPKPVAYNFGDDAGGPPVLHRAGHAEDSSSKSSAPAPAPDPDRPVLREPPKPAADKPAATTPQNDVAYSKPLPTISDPDRPRLTRGKPEGSGPSVAPTLAGLPPDMHQTIAISDNRDHPDHLWAYSWSSPEDEATMKSGLEDLARKALGPVPPAPEPETHRAKAGARREESRRAKTARTKAAPPPPPAPLEDEKFQVFQLTYGGDPTMVLSAHTQGSGADEKFITLIAGPDLYGKPLVLFKNVTDAAHLDVTPAMRLIDPVDAMADNRGELLFELRGATQRQFALYRVVNGRVEKLFTSVTESVVMPAAPASHPAP